MKSDFVQPCNECPFRRKSAPGWLGPWEPEQLLAALDYEPFPCHQTIQDVGLSFEDENLQSCAGAAIFFNNSIKMSRQRGMAEHQKLLKEIPDEVKQSVFTRPHEFIEHHTRSKRNG